MIGVHHTTEIAFVLVISMWGNDGTEWHFIGNQITLQQQMTEEQCNYLINEDMGSARYENQYYRLMAHCVPVE